MIATDIPASLRRPGVYRGVLHETTDQAAMFEPVTKAQLRVSDASLIAPMVGSALQIAELPPSRPVYVEIPTDLLTAEPGEREAETRTGSGSTEVPSADFDAGARADRARRAAADLGGRRSDARERRRGGRARWRRSSRAPVLTTYQAAGLLGREHPCDVGLAAVRARGGRAVGRRRPA